MKIDGYSKHTHSLTYTDTRLHIHPHPHPPTHPHTHTHTHTHSRFGGEEGKRGFDRLSAGDEACRRQDLFQL